MFEVGLRGSKITFDVNIATRSATCCLPSIISRNAVTARSASAVLLELLPWPAWLGEEPADVVFPVALPPLGIADWSASARMTIRSNRPHPDR